MFTLLRKLSRRLRNPFQSASRSLRRRWPLRRRLLPLRLEILEDRILLSVSDPLNQILPLAANPIALQSGPIDGDNTNDLAILSANGQLTTALNNGDGYWRSVQTQSLGLSAANGLVLAPFHGTTTLDAVVQGPNSIVLAQGEDNGQFAAAQTIFTDTAGNLAPAGGGSIQMATAVLTSDLHTDLVTVDPGANEVLVFLGNGNGTFAAPQVYASGGSQPDAVVIGDFIGDGLPDLAVGHRDGSLTFFQGLPGGTFEARPDLTVTGLGSITGLATGNFDGDSDQEIAVSSSTGVTLLNNHHQPITDPIANGSFTDGLTGWTANGPISVSKGVVQLQENSSSLLTTLQQTFVVPDHPQTLSFDLLGTNLAAPAGGLPDAFEASLLDDQQNSLVPTFEPQATSFFNVNPGSAVAKASGVTFDGQHVTLDISQLTPGTRATLYFDLIANTPSDGSTATLANVQVTAQPPNETFTETPLPGPFGSPTALVAADVNGDGHLDLVVADAGLNQLLVYNGDGQGNFTRSDIDLSAYGTGAAALAAAPLVSTTGPADVALALDGNSVLLNPLIYDPTPPQATFLDPAPGQALSTTVSQIAVQFSQPMLDLGPTAAHSVTNPAAYSLVNTTTGQTVSIASVSYNATTQQAILTFAGGADLPDGAYQIVLNSSDPTNGLVDMAGVPLTGGAAAQTTFTVEHTAPTVSSLTFTPDSLWPPNQFFVPVQAQLSFQDPLDPNPTVTLVSIASNEGDVSTEVEGAVFGTDCRTFQLEQDRDGDGIGRYYTITYLVRNAAGVGRLVAGYVVDPHDLGNQDPSWFLSTLPPPTPPGVGALVTDTVTKINNLSLSIGSSVSGDIGQAGQVDVYSFQGQAGQQLFFNAQSGSASALHWFVTDPSGNVLFSSDFADHDTLTLSAAGTYYLTVDSRPGQTGSYQFEVWNVPAATSTPMTLGQAVQGTISVPGSQAEYTFSGTAGQSLFFDVLNSNSGALAFTVRNPDGSTLLVPDNQNQSNRFTLSASGTYSVVVGHRATLDATGSYQFQIDSLPAIVPQAISLNTPTSGALTTPGQTLAYTFQGNLGQQILLNVLSNPSGVFLFTLQDPSGNALFTNQTADRALASLPAAGTYTLLVQAAGDDTGSFSFQVIDQSSVPPPELIDPAYTIGQVAGGSFTDITGRADYTFQATAGQTLFFDPINTYYPSENWSLTDPNGRQLFFSLFLEQAPITLTVSGTYTLSVISNTFGPSSYQFQVLNVTNPPPASIDIGQVVSGNMTQPGEEDTYTFQGTAGQSVFLEALGNSGNYFQLKTFTVLNPDGSVLVGPSNGDIYTFVLPTTGTYTVQVGHSIFNWDATGTYQFELISVPISPPTPINYDQSVSANLAVPGEQDQYTFQGTAGQQLYFQVMQNSGGDLFTQLKFTITGPNGQVVAGPSTSDLIDFTLPDSGTYTINVKYYYALRATGPYQFELWLVPPVVPSPITLDQVVQTALTVPGQQLEYTVQGTAGQSVYLSVQDNPNSADAFWMTGPDGTVLLPPSAFNQGPYVLPETGTYHIWIAHNSAAWWTSPATIGPVQFQLFEVIAPGASGPPSSSGTDFWLAFPQNLVQNGVFDTEPPPDMLLYVTGDQDTEGNLYIPGLNYRVFFTVQAGQTTTLTVPAAAELQAMNGVENGGIEITTRDPVSVSGLSYLATLTDGYRGLPVSALGTDYEVMAYGAGTIFSGSQLAIVATTDGTTVTVTPSQTVEGHPAGVPFTIQLNQGQTYELRGNQTIDSKVTDLTGTFITATQPVAVFGGNQAADVPAGAVYANNLVEQMPPISEWGEQYVTVPFATRQGDIFRILASADNTHVSLNGTVVATLNRGQFLDETLTAASEITADQPILVAQFAQSNSVDDAGGANHIGDPSMMLVPAVNQFLSNYTATPPATGFQVNYANLVVPQADLGAITLNGSAVPASDFTAIGDSGYYGAQISLTPGNTYQFSGPQPFGLNSYGFDVYDAYSYPGGYSFVPPQVASQLTLAPSGRGALVNTSDSVQATVLDQEGNPLAGVTVSFQVAGANPTSGTAVTDSQGHALFTYTGSQDGLDTVEASAGTLTAQATVAWISQPPTISFTSPSANSTIAAGSVVVLSGRDRPSNALAPVVQVTVNGQAVQTLDAAGDFFTQVTLGQGPTTYTAVTTDSLGQTATTSLVLDGVAAPGIAQYQDVTPLGQVQFTATTFNRHTQTLYAQAALTDTATSPLIGPVQAVFSPFTPADVSLANPTGKPASGSPYLTLLDGELQSGATASSVIVAFQDTNTERFSFGLSLLEPPQLAPQFVSLPATEAVVGQAYTYQATAQAGAASFTYSLTVAPNGMSINSSSGQITWTPTSAQVGNQQVEIVANDGHGDTVRQDFTVQVFAQPVNHPPVFQSLPITQVAVGATYSYAPTVLAPTGTTLQYSLDTAPSGMTINTQTGVVSYSAATAGSYAVQLRATDSLGDSTTQAFVLVVGSGSGDAVNFTSTPSGTATVGTLFDYLPLTTDANAQALQFTLLSGPAGMTVNPNSGQVLWTPTADQTGPQTVVLQAADALGADAVQSFTIQVQNAPPVAPPVFDSVPPVVATANAAFAYTPQVYDPSGTAVQFTLLAAPSNMTIDPNTGALTWTPTNAQIGTATVSIEATDTAGGTATQTFQLSVRGPTVAPTITSTPPATVTAGTLFRYAIAATDSSDPFTYALVSGPDGMTVDPNTGLVLWQPASGDTGSQNVDIRLTNQRGVSTDQTFTLTVVADTQPPAVSITLSQSFVNPGQTVTIQVQASDNVTVSSTTLSVNGTPLTLDASGTATYTATTSGLLAVVATATDPSGNVGTASTQLRVFAPSDTTPPTVEITGPESGDTLSYLTQITGTVTDPYFDYYRIDYAAAGSNNWTLLTQSNTAVVNGVLGTFDPTLLQNGPYTIRITAQNVNGLETIREITVNLTGQAKLGNFRESFTDLQVPLAGIPITITRTYDSLQANQIGDFGYGWSLSLGDPHIFETVPAAQSAAGLFATAGFRAGTKVYLTNADGVREGFTFTPTPEAGLLGTIWHPAFTADPGVYDTLSVDDVSLQQNPDGTFGLYLFGLAYNPQDYTLTTPDGLSYSYNVFSGLQSVSDRNGNTLTVTANGITSSAGQSIQFIRDSEGRITQIIDPAGHALTYTYDDSGNLATMTDQIGRMGHYSYLDTPAHYLSSVNEDTDGCGCQPATPPQIINYGSDGRMDGITDATGNSSSAAYNLNTDTETVADALGNKTTFVYDTQGNVLSQTDALGDTTSFQYDANNNMIARTDPLGHTTHWTYNASGKISSITDALGNKTTFTFNAFNEATQAVDAAGNIYNYVYDTRGNLLEITNPLGQTTTYTEDSEGRIATATDARGLTTHYTYDTSSKPTGFLFADGTTASILYNDLDEPVQFVDANGHIANLTYDDAGQLLSSENPLGDTTVLAYSGTQPASQTDALGRVSTYQYDAANRLIAETDPAGGVWKTTYDADGRVIAQTDPLGHTTQTFYDAAGRVVAVIDPLGNKTSYGYDADGNLTSMTDANGHTTLSSYDADNRLIKETDSLDGVTLYQYDALDNVTAITDADGHTTTMVYNALSQLVKETDPLGNVTTFSYDADGNKISETDANGHTTQWVYDSHNSVEKMIDAAGGVTSYTYDGVGNETSVTDVNGHTTTMNYDADDRLVSETDPSGATTQWTYDAVGNVSTETDPLGRVTTMTYDALDRMVSETDPTGATTKWTYDAVGNQLSQTDPLGRIITSSYDADNQLVNQTDELGGVKKFVYDAVGNLVSQTDAGGNTTSMQYDADNRVITQTDPLGHSTQYGYDAAGNLTQETDADSRLRTFAYDADNRQTSETWWQGSTAIYQASYRYDAVGNLLSASDNNSSYTYQYDTLDQVTSVDNAGTPNVPHVVLNYQYDAVGNVTQVQDNSGVTVQYAYDPRDLLISQTWSGGGIAGAKVNYGYDADGEQTSLQRYADSTGTQRVSQTLTTYDAAGRVQTLTHEDANGNALVSYQYQYDAAGQLTQESHHGNTYQYSYDANGQLTGVSENGQTTASNSYDAAGNRTSNGNVIGTGNQILSDANYTYKYDNDGNLIQKTSLSDGSVTTYAYDYRNRLTSVTETSSGGVVLHEVTYTYDIFNRRIVQSVDGVRTSFVFNGSQLWAQYNGSGAVQARYLYGQGPDDVLARWQPSSGTGWYLTDHLGTVGDILNAAGQIIDHIDYDAWGRVLAESNPSAGDGFKFTGQWYDSITGLYNYLNRWYDPQLQRFLSQDPLGWWSGQSNPYAYVANSPLNYVDPSGLLGGAAALFTQRDVTIAAAITGGTIGYYCGYLTALYSDSKWEQNHAVLYGIAGASLGAYVGGATAYYGYNSAAARQYAAMASLPFAAASLILTTAYGNRQQLKIQAGCIAASIVTGAYINRMMPPVPRLPGANAGGGSRWWNALGKFLRDESTGYGNGRPGGGAAPASQGLPFTDPNFVGPLTLEQQYARAVLSNRPWSWARDIQGGANLTAAQRVAIRQNALAQGLIPNVPFKPGTQFPDFQAAGLAQRVDSLPRNLWTASDSVQFRWLDARIPGGRPPGMTWHHSEIPGQMELVPFGPHNVTPHIGGRSPGMWANAPR